MSKRKIINDPIHGFITVTSSLIFDLISHPFLQRLRRIKQLGVSDYVYPGAEHTRFHHVLGAMHLMEMALNTLILKGHEISEQEREGALIAILLHDIGHGPFSHALENSILKEVHHEDVSLAFMHRLNREFDGKLDLAISIFTNNYEKKFLHQLVSSQLDVDRLDYLQRDCYFTGVSEGTIGSDRLITMINVADNELVVDEKGILSIENFINARRIMYWQVYLHKTAIAAERMLINVFKRALELNSKGEDLNCSDTLRFFIENRITTKEITENESVQDTFSQLDDYDMWGAVKGWRNHKDKILSYLASSLLDRDLFGIKVSNEPLYEDNIAKMEDRILKEFECSRDDLHYYLNFGSITNEAYTKGQKINLLKKSGEVIDLASAGDLPNIQAMTKIVRKYYVCYPKNLSL